MKYNENILLFGFSGMFLSLLFLAVGLLLGYISLVYYTVVFIVFFISSSFFLCELYEFVICLLKRNEENIAITENDPLIPIN